MLDYCMANTIKLFMLTLYLATTAAITLPATIPYFECIKVYVSAYRLFIAMNVYVVPYNGKVWGIDSFQALGERKLGKLIDRLINF